jgi:hypothetical protein
MYFHGKEIKLKEIKGIVRQGMERKGNMSQQKEIKIMAR